MPNILIARLQQLHQYNSTTATILWEDPTPKRWTDIYSRLTSGDDCIFLSEGRLLIGKVDTINVNASIAIHQVRSVQLQNDNFLRIHIAQPEQLSRMKANFPPFLSPVAINVDDLYIDASAQHFISYYIVKGSDVKNAVPDIENNDRVITIENGVFANFGIYQNGLITPLTHSNNLFNIKGKTLQEILNIHKAATNPEAKRGSINVGYVENIIKHLSSGNYYKFRSFNEYYNIVHNKRVYLGMNAPDEGETDNFEDTSNNNYYMKPSLNTILYGSPGTGKTFNTINKALKIVMPDYEFTGKKREEIKRDYDALVSKGRIAFCTFHQSMSYEDFIEGIKPIKPEVGDTFVKYDIVDGIFKQIANNARFKPSNAIKSFSITGAEFHKANFYKMSLGSTQNPDDEDIYKFCIENGYIALGWGDSYDYSGMTELQISQAAQEYGLNDFETRAIKTFIHYLRNENYVVISYGNYFFRAIGKVIGEYEYKENSPIRYNHFRKVEWLLHDVETPVGHIYNKNFSQQSIYKLDKSGIKKDFFVKAPDIQAINTLQTGNYVLIIDEINRGNISQIFGELITLIEEDKREGNPEALTVTLPYSKQPFSVPANLYILGTMNTADRSVEALDAALRRRFVFEQMPPIPGLLVNDDNTEKSINDISLKRLLEVMNERITYLLDEDHQIGHSYFMNTSTIEEVRAAFHKSIIPLLKEYFYNDHEKIMLVLGKGFVTGNDKAPGFAGNDYAESERTTYNFAKTEMMSDVDFVLALKILLNEA